MTLPTPAIDVATTLNTAAVAVLGTSLFACPELPQSDRIPAQCIFVIPSGGPPNDDFLGDAPHGINHSRVQVVVRAAPFDMQSGETLARNVWDALHHATINGWMECKCSQGFPVYFGLNDQQQPRWSVNLEMMRQV